MEIIQIGFQAATELGNLSKSFSVNGLRFQIGRNLAAEIFLCKDHRPVYEVSEDRH